ncbi:MAG TPA: lamin tail domain-containing protein [Longimicrobium sp.]|nr:lamin tail domain-containing protein [Longimicrobium sp.]
MKRAGFVFAPAAALVLAACADRNPVATVDPPAARPSADRLECAVRVREAALTCGAGLAGGARGVAIGGQNVFVRLVSANVAYDSASQTLGADVSVQNLLEQAMGTIDGATPDPAGIRVFFHTGPTVVQGSGNVWVSNADGQDAFTASLQPFFRYPGILSTGQTSAVKRWTWHVDPAVTLFRFSLFVETRLSPALVINEIMAHPTTASEAAGEWFEIRNTGRDSVNLDGWTIASGGDAGYTIHGPLVIRRGEYLVLGASTDTVANGGTPVALAYTGVDLGNDNGDWLVLRSPAGQAVDSVDWGAAAGEPGSPPPAGVALELASPTDDNLFLSGAGSAWRPAVNAYGTGQKGTPGARNVRGISLVALAVGGSHACGLDAVGQAWCWGSLVSPDGAFATPVSQPAGTHFVQIVSMASPTSCAMDESSRVFCWGQDVPLGTTIGYSRSATPIPQPDGVQFASLWGGMESGCALTPDGQAWCWGWLPASLSPSAIAMPLPQGVRFSSMGLHLHLCGLSPTGQAYCAGFNDYGTLGDGTLGWRESFAPVHQSAGVTFASIDASFGTTCALTPAGQAYCWGGNSLGQLGDGTTENRLTPVAVQQPPDVSFTAISAINFHTCALSSAGQVYCWGATDVADGIWIEHHTPTPVRHPPGVLFSTVGVGFGYSCALERVSGQPYCWGINTSGQLGDGTGMVRPGPVAVTR